jgi:uncharacterized protein
VNNIPHDDVSHTVRDNPERERYELIVDGRLVSIAEYHIEGSIAVVSHVETDRALRGRGNADLLMRGLLDDLRSRKMTISPLCSFAATFVRDHPDDADLVA